ncbi:MAG: FtsH protease activity modulator HflK [Candidatus Omnitrophica bacterium]|nr:FtsH protease activity modulator HflK [Candidatus Omnitrophota bacterium]
MDINYPREGMPKMPPFAFGPFIGPILILVVVFASLNTLFYQIGPDEVGVIQRFGKYTRKTNPGLQMKLPFGIETVKKIKVTHVFKEEFGFRTVTPGVRTIYMGRDDSFSQRVGGRQTRSSTGDPFMDESLMLTGDLNMAVVEWIVQYTIKNPVQYAFRIRNPQETIRNMSEAVMRLVIGDHTINEVLTSGRVEIQQEVEKKLQELLDDYGSGIQISNVILQDVTPPNEVKPSFNEVNEARQEKEKVINQAWEEYNRVIPRAKGQAEQKIREAEGYALERINQAKGDGDRFTLAWEAYKMAPVVTKRRLYLETVAKVFPNLGDLLVLDYSQKGVLPLLDLKKQEGAKES